VTTATVLRRGVGDVQGLADVEGVKWVKKGRREEDGVTRVRGGAGAPVAMPMRALASSRVVTTSGHVTSWRMPTLPVSLACTSGVSEMRVLQ
jgi:hypothetical protein